MKRLLALLVAAVLIATPALAQTDIHTSGLTDAQKAELALQAARLAEKNKTDAQTAAAAPDASKTLEQVSKYAQLGQSIGAGLASTAKEMGIAVNDFANTPIGKIATIIIVFKLIGWEIIKIIVGFIWFLTMVPLWFYIFRRICLVSAKVIETNTDTAGRGTKVKRWEYIDSKNDKDGSIVGYRILMLVVLAIVVIAGFIVMF